MSDGNPLTRRQAMKMAALCALSAPFIGPGSVAAAGSDSPAGANARAERLKLGVASFSLAKLSCADIITVLKRLEIGGVSLYKNHAPWTTGTPEECRAIANQFREAGIAVTSTGVVDLTKDEAAARRAFENVRAAGLPMMCGRPAPEALPLVDKLVKEYGIKVGIHNHGPTDLYPTGDDVWRAVQPYDERIGLCLDVGHSWRAGGDPAAEILKCHSRLYQVHLKDTRGPRGGDTTKDPSPVVVGRGLLDIKAILSAAIKVNYPHWVDFEYEERVADKVPGLAESVGYARGMLAAMS
jgi:inosose dehydratase